MNSIVKQISAFVLLVLLLASCKEDFQDEVINENEIVAAGQTLKLTMSNGTNGAFSDDEIYYAVIGLTPGGSFGYVNPQGQMIAMSTADNEAPNKLTKNGENYSNFFMKLSDVPVLNVPQMQSGRIFIGLGSPLYIKSFDDGFAGPNFANASDPNIDVFIEYAEFTFSEGGFWGNTTQVDQFGFPMTMQLVNESGMTQTVGMTDSRSDIIEAFKCSVPQEFVQLAEKQSPYRVLAPIQGGFNDGEEHANYFDSYIDKMWDKYKSEDLVIVRDGVTWRGRVINNVLTYTNESGESYTVKKPTSPEVFRCDGVFNDRTGFSGDLGIQLQLQAYTGAAFQRQIMGNGPNWPNPETWYADRSEKANFYAQFWHFFGIQGFAYGFPYDDVWEQSTLVHDTNPRDLNINITWD
ncbi:glycoside hydrolase family 64 protein [Xanthovirga aplysinae]|uniref:glycoside hydrolase family 64 protein n=1 Tax=Xanthovirga aplysinae TaxID=2529853 RepID=UPI0012BD517E|nr:glycoside hydrolase family 64 protein [Xanthovirga aplysinae]MTI29983.1 hypothetical protein [Xanthovirga aplysinae]